MNRLFLILALLFAALPARAQVIVKCRTSGGALVDCSTPLNNGYVNWAAPGSLGSGTPNTVRGTTITATTQFTGSGAGLTNVPASSVAGSLSGVTIDCSSNTCQNIANAALIAGIDALKIGAGLVSNSEFGYLDGVTSPIQTQIDGLGVLVNLLVNDGYTLFLHRAASDIATYETLRSEPASGMEKIDSVAVTSGTSPQLLGAYVTDPGVPGVGTLPSGMWGFREFASVSNTSGTSTILVRVYKRDTGGAETLLFETTSPAITTTSATLYYWIYTQTSDFPVNNTDRIVIRYYGQTTSGASRTVSHYYEGSTHASWLSTPMPAPLPVSGAQAQIVATPPSATGQVSLRSLTTDYFPVSGVTASAYPTAGLIPTFTVDAYGRLTAAGSASSLSGVTINCSSNTCSNVSLTAAVTGVLPIANGGTNSNVALNNSRAIVSSGGAIIETASACGTGTVLNGGTPPNCTATPIIGTTLTVPRINSSGLILDATTGNNVQISINSTTVQTVTATGVTLAQPLAMSNQTISGLPAATASPGGQALAWPWITSTASFNTLSSGFTITAANGTYAGTGLTYTFSGAGTYWCVGTVRSSVAVSVGAGANISLKLRNTTTSTDLTNSIRIGAYASTVGAAYITTTPMAEVVTVTGADTIEVYAASNTGTTYTARSVDSDTAGYSKLGCMKIAP